MLQQAHKSLHKGDTCPVCGKKIEEFSVLQIYGEVSEGTINGSEASPDVLKKRFESLPSGEALVAYFRDVEKKE